MTARVLAGGSEVRPEKSLKSGHDRSAFVELASAQEPPCCPTCLTSLDEDGYCSGCSFLLVRAAA